MRRFRGLQRPHRGHCHAIQIEVRRKWHTSTVNASQNIIITGATFERTRELRFEELGTPARVAQSRIHRIFGSIFNPFLEFGYPVLVVGLAYTVHDGFG